MTGDQTHPNFELINLYYDGEGNEHVLAFVEDHLKSCEDCRKRLVELQELSKSLQDMKDLEAPRRIGITVEALLNEPEDDTVSITPVSKQSETPAAPAWMGRVAAVVIVPSGIRVPDSGSLDRESQNQCGEQARKHGPA